MLWLLFKFHGSEKRNICSKIPTRHDRKGESWEKSAGPNMAQKLVGQYLLALALYPHSAERLHLISAGHQIMSSLAQNDITGKLLGKTLNPGSQIHRISHQGIGTPLFAPDDTRQHRPGMNADPMAKWRHALGLEPLV